MQTLLLVGPAEYRAPLGRAFRAAGFRVRFRRRPQTRRPADHHDPWSVGRAIRGCGDVDGAILIAPPGETATTALPGPLVEGVPCGVVFSRRPDDLSAWMKSIDGGRGRARLWSVLAMERRSYTSLARRFARWMREAHPRAVETWWSRSLARWEVCDRLAAGPRLALYVGHGRPRGLAGYHGLRWHHVAECPQLAPCGVFVCLACDTLRTVGRRTPFGRRWVDSGRAAAFFGAVDAVLIGANRRLAEAIGRELASGPASLGELLVRLRDAGAAHPIGEALRSYRIVGHPLVPL